MKSRTAIALVVSGIAVLGALPVIAQQAAPASTTAQISGPASQQAGDNDRDGNRDGDRGHGRDRGPAFLVGGCGPSAAERVDVALVRLSHRLNLTAEQQPLFDAFKSAVATAQQEFETVCATSAPPAPGDDQQAPPADGAAPADAQQAPDMLAMLKSGLTIEEARVKAMQSILPSFEALYNVLTPEQKLAFAPDGMGRDGRGHDRDGKPGFRQGMQDSNGQGAGAPGGKGGFRH